MAKTGPKFPQALYVVFDGNETLIAFASVDDMSELADGPVGVYQLTDTGTKSTEHKITLKKDPNRNIVAKKDRR